MDRALLEAFRKLDAGKRVGTARYLHVALVEMLSDALQGFLLGLLERAGLEEGVANVFKIELYQGRVSLLSYPGFWDEGFPRLLASWTFSSGGEEAPVHRRYAPENPPILHRKELLLPAVHPEVPRLEALTRAAEEAGLFANTQIIGRLRRWELELEARGLRVEGHQLVAVHLDSAPEPSYTA